MKITKYEHSTILLEKDSGRVIFDPVEITQTLPDFENVAAIIITHRHSDHCQPEVIEKIISSNPAAKLFTTQDTVPNLSGFSPTVVKDGDTMEIGGFKLQFFGKDHASLGGMVPCENIGAVVDDVLSNPGDSFDVPPVKTPVLLAPISAPWCKAFETIEYINKANPNTVIPVHDALLSDFGQEITYNVIHGACQSTSIKYLLPGDSIDT